MSVTVINRHPDGTAFEPREILIARDRNPELYQIIERSKTNASSRSYT